MQTSRQVIKHPVATALEDINYTQEVVATHSKSCKGISNLLAKQLMNVIFLVG